jgi:1-acyl-sn-glycerol-3-phosphate acyltransferase
MKELMESETIIQTNAAHAESRRWPKAFGRLWYFWSLFVAGFLVGVFGPPVIAVCWLLNQREKLYPWALWGARMWFRLSGIKIVIKGEENLDHEKSYVFICNHRSYLDTAAIFAFAGQRIGVIAKKELLKIPVFGYGMGYVNVIAIDRSNNQRAVETMKVATDKLLSGVSFAVFAEGTRAMPGEFLPFKKGGFYMAIEADVPIVPVAIKNTDFLMGKKTGVAQPGTIEMVFLPPVSTEGLSTDEDVVRLRDDVHAMIGEELYKTE